MKLNITNGKMLNNSGKPKTWGNRLVKEGIMFLWVQLLVVASAHVAPTNAEKSAAPDLVKYTQVARKDILKQSQVSYRAEGGFSGVISYGVIISCVEGKISVLKSIHDPRLTNSDSRKREIGKMSQKEYLALWNKLQKISVLNTRNAPDPRLDILDEFTLTFNVNVGKKRNSFQVYGIGRPEAARQFAVKSLIDTAAHMDSLWNSRQSTAKK